MPDRFEVASIKPSGTTGNVITFRLHHGGVIAREVTLAFLVQNSFQDIRSDDQIINAPNWFFSTRFDVEAKPPVADGDIRAWHVPWEHSGSIYRAALSNDSEAIICQVQSSSVRV